MDVHLESLPSRSVVTPTEYEKEKTMKGQLSVCMPLRLVLGRIIFKTKSVGIDVVTVQS